MQTRAKRFLILAILLAAGVSYFSAAFNRYYLGVAIDVGIGFGKTMEHNLQLLAHLRRFTKWDCPLLLGVSRKSFMGHLLGASVDNRLSASLACACWAVQNGVQIVRTHDVEATRQAIRMTEALMARE